MTKKTLKPRKTVSRIFWTNDRLSDRNFLDDISLGYVHISVCPDCQHEECSREQMCVKLQPDSSSDFESLCRDLGQPSLSLFSYFVPAEKGSRRRLTVQDLKNREEAVDKYLSKMFKKCRRVGLSLKPYSSGPRKKS